MRRDAMAAVDGSVRELLAHAATLLSGDSARLDAELLLAQVLGRTRTWLFAHPEAPVAPDTRAAFDALLARRRAGEPVAYLRGEQEFWSLPLAVSPATLVPRPETELLVELALPRGGPAVLDLGTGSGAIALALARERPDWRVLGIDIDPDAVAVARANALRLGLANARFAVGDWYAGIGSTFALIVSNPPYIRADDPCLAALRHEPLRALASGSDGLDALRVVIGGAPRHLWPGGWLLCEHGAEQGAAVRALFTAAGFGAVETRRDLAARDRVTLGRRDDREAT